MSALIAYMLIGSIIYTVLLIQEMTSSPAKSEIFAMIIAAVWVCTAWPFCISRLIRLTEKHYGKDRD